MVVRRRGLLRVSLEVGYKRRDSVFGVRGFYFVVFFFYTKFLYFFYICRASMIGYRMRRVLYYFGIGVSFFFKLVFCYGFCINFKGNFFLGFIFIFSLVRDVG